MSLKISRRNVLKTAAAAVGTFSVGRPVLAQAWPSQPIRIIVTAPAGGVTDLMARAYGAYISEAVGQPVVIDNRAGGNGMIGAVAVKEAPADGHTLLFTITTVLVMNRVLFKSVPYDSDRDFVLISSMSPGQLPLVAHKSTGATNLKEFADYARSTPVSFGTYGAGTYAHMAAVELNKHFGLNVVVVHYRGEAPMWQDFNAGIIQAAIGSYQGSSGVLQSGTGRAIAIWPQRSRQLPGVATFPEQGVNSKLFHLKGFVGLAGPAGMPRQTVERLSALMVDGGKSARVQKVLETFDINEAAEGHQAFKKLYDEEKPVWIELVNGLGLAQL